MRWWRWSPHNACHWRDRRGRPVPRRRAVAAWAAGSCLRVRHCRRWFRSKRPIPRASLGGWSTWASSSGHAPATTIHWRRLSRSCFRAARTCCRVARFTSRNSASSGPVSGRALPWYLSMETSPFGEGCKPTESRANSTRKLQIRSPRLPPGASWSEGGGVRAGYSDVLRRSCEKSVPTGSFEALGHSPLVRAGSQATSFVVGDGCEESSANMLSGMPNRPLNRGAGRRIEPPTGSAIDFASLMMQA